MTCFGLFLLLSGSVVLCRADLLDLTYSMDNTTLFWPNGQNSFLLEILSEGRTEAGFWYQGDQLCAGTHVGTHMDAPVHFYEGSWGVAEIPASHLAAPGVIVDIREKARREADSNVSLSDVQGWETEYGEIPRGALVLMCSGWSARYPNRSAVFGNDRDDASDFHFPGFDVEAVEWLIEKRGIVGIGVDTPSMDYGPSSSFPTHVLTAEHNVYGLENVYQPCKVPPSGATIYALPAKYDKASGAPVRVLANWDIKPSSSGTSAHPSLLGLTITLISVYSYSR